MSRYSDGAHTLRLSFPRVSGDEPVWQDTVKALALFSPRERG